jgi:hypothetical protein
MTRLDHHTATPTRLLGLMAMGLALVAANVSPVQAQEAPRVFQACFVPGSGAVYLIGEPGLPEECSVTGRHVHVEFNWTDGLEGNDHGALNGLDQDDHKQYLLVDALTRALIANLNAAGHKITNLAAATAAGEAVRYEQAVKAGDAAGGDLAGAYPAPSVAQIQGHPVSDAEPAADDVLTWDGQQWTPTNPGFAGTAHTHSATDIISGVLPPARGGTGLTSVNSGDILYGGAAGSFGRQAIGGNGQVLTVVDGLPTWADASAGVGDHGALDNLNADDHTQYVLANGVRATTDGFAVTGEFGSGKIPVSGEGVRLMWYPGKAAFRAGRIWAGNSQWDDANIGEYSAAFGQSTTASGTNSFAIGHGSVASGGNSFAAGFASVASGAYSVALGFQASTYDPSGTLRRGVFVFSDNSITLPTRPTHDHQAVFRAFNGLRFFNSHGNSYFTFEDGGTGSGCRIVAGSLTCTGSITAASDVNGKMDFEDVDAEGVLSRLAGIPVRKWSYRGDGLAVRHVGPTAQDFRAAFGLGDSERTIATVDADGINMLAIQALEKRTAELKTEIQRVQALEERVARLETQNVEMEQRLERLDAMLRDTGMPTSRR